MNEKKNRTTLTPKYLLPVLQNRQLRSPFLSCFSYEAMHGGGRELQKLELNR